MRISREKVIIFCLYALVLLSILQLFNGYYAKANEYTNIYLYYMNESSILARLQSLVYLLAVTTSISFIIDFDKLVNRTILLLSFCVVSWFVVEILSGNSIRSLFLSGVSPCIYFSVFCITFGKNDYMWNKIKQNAPILSIICSTASVIFAATAITKYHMVTGRAPYLIMLTYAFWFIAVTVFCTDAKPVLKWILMFYCILISIIYGSRGWTITSMLMLIMFIFRENREKRNKVFTKSLIIPMVILLLYLFGTSIFADQFNYFFGRIGESTRAEQYQIILNNIDFNSLLGRGMNASYSFGGNQQYQYFDNVFIFNTLHFGLIMACSYYFLLLIPIVRLVRRKRYSLPETEKGLLYIFILWFVSINGLSVYNGITYDSKNIFLMLCLGRLLYVSSQPCLCIEDDLEDL